MAARYCDGKLLISANFNDFEDFFPIFMQMCYERIVKTESMNHRRQN